MSKKIKTKILAILAAVLIIAVGCTYAFTQLGSGLDESRAADLAEDQVDVMVSANEVQKEWSYVAGTGVNWIPAQSSWTFDSTSNAILCSTNNDAIVGFANTTKKFEEIEFWTTISQYESGVDDDDVIGVMFHTNPLGNDKYSGYLWLMEAGGWNGCDLNGPYHSPDTYKVQQQNGSITGLYKIENGYMDIRNLKLVSMPRTKALHWTQRGDTTIHASIKNGNIQIYVNGKLEVDVTDNTITSGYFGFFENSQPAKFKDIHYIARLATYEVSFDGNAPSGVTITDGGTKKAISSKTYTWNLPKPECDGYIFKGWNTKPDGTGTDMTNRIGIGKPVDITSSMKLYAQWEKTDEELRIKVKSNTDGFGSATVSWPDYNYVNRNFKVYQSADGGTT